MTTTSYKDFEVLSFDGEVFVFSILRVIHLQKLVVVVLALNWSCCFYILAFFGGESGKGVINRS